MAEAYKLSANVRERAGKGAARATRREGRVPAVIYGDKKDSVMISVEPVELQKLIRTGGFFSTLVEIEADGAKHRVLARDIQLDPVTDRPLHIDFLRVSKGVKIAVNVPMHFINEEACEGLTRGGVLNIVRHDVELNVSPEAIPEYLDIDLTGLEIGDSIHITSLKLPDGVTPTIDRDFTIATIAAPTKAVEEEVVEVEEGEEGAEGAEEGAEGAEKEGGEA